MKIKPLEKFFYEKKIEQNCRFIEKNKKPVLKKLKNKKVLKVIFYVYDSSKWKCQVIYDRMKADKRFEPLVVVTRNSAKNPDNPSFQSEEEILKTYEYFKNLKMNVELGFDFEINKHIPFEKFNPDIIIYQHPWYVETSQGPVVCSKFALTYYVPYDISTTALPLEYDLRFYSYIETYFVVNDKLKDFYSQKMKNGGKNLKTAGVLSFEYFQNNSPVNDKQYIIYAPHWTIDHEKTIAYSTFKENGKFMLDYAKQNPQYNWVFKPHPMLKKAIIDNGFMSEEETEKYYSDWENLGILCTDGDYLKYFNDSQLMITDCCSFLSEYLPTGKPLIRLVSKDIPEFNPNLKELIKSYYNAESVEDLRKYLDMILVERQDPMKDLRVEALKIYPSERASQKIIDSIIEDIS